MSAVQSGVESSQISSNRIETSERLYSDGTILETEEDSNATPKSTSKLEATQETGVN